MNNKNKQTDEKKKKDEENNDRVFAYRDKINECMERKKVFELEQVLNELCLDKNDTVENLKLYKNLRLNIIHGQICLANFFEHKNNLK